VKRPGVQTGALETFGGVSTMVRPTTDAGELEGAEMLWRALKAAPKLDTSPRRPFADIDQHRKHMRDLDRFLAAIA